MEGRRQDGGNFHLNDETFLAFERALAVSRWSTPDLIALRVNIFLHLGYDSPQREMRRFQFGLLSYLPWLIRSWWSGRLRGFTKSGPKSDFLILVYGAVSKEVDSLAPVASELAKCGHSVTILWAADGDLDERRFSGSTVLQICPTTVTNPSFRGLCGDLLYSASLMLRLRFGLRRFPGFLFALRKRGVKLFDYLVHLRFWERFLASFLSQCNPKAVAFVADTSLCGEALARLCLQQGVPSHHFLHGFPGLEHTRSLATDIHCFSEADREYFQKHGWLRENVHALGHPRQKGIAASVARIRTLAPESGDIRVLFGSQLAIAGAFDEAHYRQTAITVLEAARRLGLTQNEYRVRLHPSDDPAAYLKLARGYPDCLGQGAISGLTVAEDLAWANIVVTASSTMAVEAAYAGCYLIWLLCGDFRIDVQKALVAANYGGKAHSADELTKILESFRNPATRSYFIENFMRVAKELKVLSLDGTEASAGIMERSLVGREKLQISSRVRFE